MSITNVQQWAQARRATASGLAVCVAVLTAAVAFADADSYEGLRSTPSELITGATAADSTTATTVITDRMRSSNSNTTVAVSVDFSGTAGAYVDAAGDNVAPLLYFDLSGATTYEIRHAAPSVGNVDLTWWCFGARSQQ